MPRELKKKARMSPKRIILVICVCALLVVLFVSAYQLILQMEKNVESQDVDVPRHLLRAGFEKAVEESSSSQ